MICIAIGEACATGLHDGAAVDATIATAIRIYVCLCNRKKFPVMVVYKKLV